MVTADATAAATPNRRRSHHIAATPKLIYDPDCPNVERARERLRQAVAERGQALGWTEWQSDDPALPDYARAHGPEPIPRRARAKRRCPDIRESGVDRTAPSARDSANTYRRWLFRVESID